jgi:hypothetical protein
MKSPTRKAGTQGVEKALVAVQTQLVFLTISLKLPARHTLRHRDMFHGRVRLIFPGGGLPKSCGMVVKSVSPSIF